MIFDEIDFQILERFYKLKKNEESTTWKIMKSIFKNGGNKENNIVKRRIEQMAKINLFKIEKNSPTTFVLDLNKIFFKKFSFPTRRSRGIAILVNDKYETFEL